MIFQDAPGVVVVGGAGWGSLAEFYQCPARQVEVGYLGLVVIEPVEVVLEILPVVWQLQDPTLVCCLLGVFKEVIVMLARGLQ